VATVLCIFVTVDVKLLIRRSFDTFRKYIIIGLAKTGPAGPLPTAMSMKILCTYNQQWLKWFCEAEGGGSPNEAGLEQTTYPFQPH